MINRRHAMTALAGAAIAILVPSVAESAPVDTIRWRITEKWSAASHRWKRYEHTNPHVRDGDILRFPTDLISPDICWLALTAQSDDPEPEIKCREVPDPDLASSTDGSTHA